MQKFRLFLYLFLVGFLLNLVWENAQAPLYEGYEDFWSHFMLCFWASLLDAAVILFMYVALAFWYRDFYWLDRFNSKIAILVAIAGAFIALVSELWAIKTETWAYSSAMPLLPYVEVGLSPLLQMTLLPVLTFYLLSLKTASGNPKEKF